MFCSAFNTDVYALIGTNANHAVGLNDFITEFRIFLPNVSKTPGQVAIDFTSDLRTYYANGNSQDPNGGKFFFYFNSQYYWLTGADWTVTNRIAHVIIFADRSGSAYVYVDGVLLGSGDISAQVAYNMTATSHGICYTQSNRAAAPILCSYRRFILTADTFPTVAQMDDIAKERFNNPEKESPTLLARTNYATERRIDIDFNDVAQDGTTVPNLGTGASTFTIGSSLHWHDTRIQAGRINIAQPPEDFYSVDATHTATNASANLGFIQGAYVVELIMHGWYNMRTAGGACILIGSSPELLRVYGGLVSGYLAYEADYYSGGAGAVYTVIENKSGYLAPNYLDGIFVHHMVVDPTNMKFINFINGQQVNSQAISFVLNLAGNMVYSMPGIAGGCHPLALRAWNAATLSAAYADIICKRVPNPWSATDNTFAGMTLKLNYEMRMNNSIGQGASSTLVKNLANPGTGDSTISGGGTWGNSTIKVLNGRA